MKIRLDQTNNVQFHVPAYLRQPYTYLHRNNAYSLDEVAHSPLAVPALIVDAEVHSPHARAHDLRARAMGRRNRYSRRAVERDKERHHRNHRKSRVHHVPDTRGERE